MGLEEELGYPFDPEQAGACLAVKVQPRRLPGQADADGVAMFERLLPGWYYWVQRNVCVKARSGETTDLVDRDPLPEDVPPAPVGATTVRGRVLVGGEPWSRGVQLDRTFVLTDEAGRYSLEGLRPGVHRLHPPAFPAFSPAAPVPFEVPNGATEVELDWDFPRCELHGKVVTSEGTLPERLRLELVTARDQEYPYGEAAERVVAVIPVRDDTSFVHSNVTTGRYRLVSRGKGYRIAAESFEVGNGEPDTLELTLRFERADVTFRLHVRDAATGGPISVGDCTLTRAGESLCYAPDSFGEGREGPLEWHGLPPGMYRYGVDGSGLAHGAPHGFAYDTVEVSATSGLVEKVLELPPGGSLVVEVADGAQRRFAEPMPTISISRPDGSPAAIPSRDFLPGEVRTDTRVADPPGVTFFRDLPVGVYRVSAAKRGFLPASQLVEVRRGETAEVEIILGR